VLRRRFLLLAAAPAAVRSAGDEEKVWREYVEWYRRQPISVTDPRRSYLEHLERSGLGAAAIQERAKVIERFSIQRREELHPFFFDRTYSSGTPRFNAGPNSLLAEAVRDKAPGRALDVHMGQGRNAVFLASKGWQVTGFDFSAEGVRAAEAAARKAGVSLTALVRRHEDFDFGRARWDLVVMSYTWVPLREPYIQRIVESLRPRGLLVFEHLMDESGSEGAAAWLPKPNQLLQVFGGLRILRYEDVRASADWSWRPERIARLVGEK